MFVIAGGKSYQFAYVAAGPRVDGQNEVGIGLDPERGLTGPITILGRPVFLKGHARGLNEKTMSVDDATVHSWNDGYSDKGSTLE